MGMELSTRMNVWSKDVCPGEAVWDEAAMNGDSEKEKEA